MPTMNVMTVREFEAAVKKLEGFTLIIRRPVGSLIPAYENVRSYKGGAYPSNFIMNRLQPLGLSMTEVEIVDGTGRVVGDNMLLSHIRDTYTDRDAA